jgi:acyl-CoA synthetase (AMP-forming)/AMP-acid ligase II
MVTRPAGARGRYHRGTGESLDEAIQSRLLGHAARDPRAPFLLAPARATMSYGLMAEHLAQVRERFGAWGIARGDIVAMPAFDRAIACMLLAAAPSASALALLPMALGADGCGELLDRMQARAVLLPAGVATPLGAAAAARGIARIEVAPAGDAAGAFSLSLADAGRTLDGSSPRHDPRWAHIGITSGTTARPKIVPYRHDSLLAITAAMGELFALGPGDASGLVTPIHLANGQRSAFLLPVMNGGCVECLPEADVGALLDAIRADRLSYFNASFTIMRALLERLGPGGRVRSTRLRFVRVASGALDPAELAALERALGVPAVVGLATTETGIVTHQRLPPAPRTHGGLGHPVRCELRIVDADGRDVARGEIGEVLVRGPQVFDGYLDDDALSASALSGGWYRTGDLARIGDDGELRLAGRAAEIVNRGGDKISPLEVDAALRAIPGVADAAAFGVAHPTLGQEVAAAVVLVTGAELSEAEILAAASARLGARRAPRRVWFVDALPRNEAGKVVRTRLAALVGYVAPSASPLRSPPARSPLEAAIAALWAAALDVPHVAPDARFGDLGGGADQAVVLIMQVRDVFGVALPPDTLDDGTATPARMARDVDAARGNST